MEDTLTVSKDTLILTLRSMIDGADDLEQIALLAAISLMEQTDSDGIEFVPEMH